LSSRLELRTNIYTNSGPKFIVGEDVQPLIQRSMGNIAEVASQSNLDMQLPQTHKSHDSVLELSTFASTSDWKMLLASANLYAELSFFYVDEACIYLFHYS
jgi:hypothetical protein